jgi:hypothetical protein
MPETARNFGPKLPHFTGDGALAPVLGDDARR